MIQHASTFVLGINSSIPIVVLLYSNHYYCIFLDFAFSPFLPPTLPLNLVMCTSFAPFRLISICIFHQSIEKVIAFADDLASKLHTSEYNPESLIACNCGEFCQTPSRTPISVYMCEAYTKVSRLGATAINCSCLDLFSGVDLRGMPRRFKACGSL